MSTLKGRERPQPRTGLLLTYLVAGKRENGTVNIIDAHPNLTKPVTHSGYVEEKGAAHAALHGLTLPHVGPPHEQRASADPA